MISLVPTAEPTQGVRVEQPQVRCKWETRNLGCGTLYVTEQVVVWLEDAGRGGFTLTYPSIGIYGQTAATEQEPEPALFMQIDLSKTGEFGRGF